MTVLREDKFEEVMVLILSAIYRETDAKFAALESKLTRLETAQQEFSYKGNWQEGKQYKRGNFVTLGSVWHANVDTRSKPGSDSDWALVVPKPRDGRDGKDYVPPEPPERRTTRSHR